MKINEVILEALNTKTGTPNGNTNPGYQNDEVHDDPKTGQTDFSGVKQAAQGASMLGKGIAKGAQAAGRFAQSFIPGTAANQMRQAQKTVAPSIQASKENLKIELGQWQKYIQQRGTTVNLKDPDAVRQQLVLWANSRYPSTTGQVDINKVNPSSPATIVKYISDRYNNAMANQSIGATGAPAADKEPTAKPSTPSSIIVPNKVGAGPRQPADTTQADATAQDTQQHDLAPGAQIVSQEPIIIKYKNKEYGLNDRGQWVQFGTSKVPHEAFQTFLDRQAGY